MLNYWWVTRPKRKLDSVPEVLAALADISLNQEWDGQVGTHLEYEKALEVAGLKREGERRDQRGGGGRTYKAWLVSLGLIFTQNSTGRIKLTLAGEAIMNGDSPVKVITNQILKYQFPSAFSVSKGVRVADRFKIRPFRFLLKLLMDSRIRYLTEEEIAKIIVTEAENESVSCYEYIVHRIDLFRNYGDGCLEPDFILKYQSGKGGINLDHPYSHLLDLANTLANWLEYTQLVRRESGRLYILDDKKEEVADILNTKPPFIEQPENHEYYQRRYGVDPKHQKDNRDLTKATTITPIIIARQKVKQSYISQALIKPITRITPELVLYISSETGIKENTVEEILMEYYPKGSISAYLTKYFEMAFKGRENAVDFEKATATLFSDVFGLKTKHVGPIGLTPDVLLESDEEGYQAIIDNKAYRQYSITNDHHNRMVHNYLNGIKRYSECGYPIAFFSYIAGGFTNNIDSQIQSIYSETGVPGSVISVSNVIKMVEKQEQSTYSHKKIKELFSINRQILLSDI